uniref:EFHB C-terminal EF-hand domain-containing protein n=1 Tax=Eutreptiella gymnastica TaxID=73025 RepID=A0A7S1I3L1_9EUGL
MAAASPLCGSNAGKFKDEFPGLRAAGRVLTDPSDNVQTCMTYDPNKIPKTPPAIVPYRQSYKNTPGQTIIHYGKAKDDGPPDMRFGYINDYSSNAKQLMSGQEESAFLERMRTLKESAKGLGQNDPLGKSGNKHGIILPDKCKDPNFMFGSSIKASEHTSKDLIFPTNDPFDDPDEATHRMYVKTHGSYEAGEQKKIGYNWLAHGIDPQSFRFGLVDKNWERDGASRAMRPDNERMAKTNLVKVELENFKTVAHDALGAPKNYGYGLGRKLGPDHVFGRGNKVDEWDARRCMQGEYSVQDQMPDPTMSKATRPGFRNLNPEGRTFGMPTVRGDKPKPKFKKVTDFRNYGDEPGAEGVMYPCKYQDHQIHAEDFATGYTKEFMWGLQKDAGIGLDEATFETVWNHATSISPGGTVCVESFRRAMSDLDV